MTPRLIANSLVAMTLHASGAHAGDTDAPNFSFNGFGTLGAVHRVNRIGLAASALALALSAGAAAADVVAVVCASSPVVTLSKNQIADIFLGKATRFPDGSRAVPVDLSEGTVERDEFYSRFTGKSAAQIKAHWSRVIFTGRGQPPKAVANGGEARKLLAANPAAIGYMERSLVDGSVKVLLQQ